MKNIKGFTLVEIVVVVIVIGILAGIAIPQYYSKIIERSKGEEAKQILYRAYAGFQRRVADGESTSWSLVFNNWTALGMGTPPSGFFTYSINNAGKVIALRVGDASKNFTMSLDTGILTKTDPY